MPLPKRLFWYAVCIAFSAMTIVQIAHLFIRYRDNPIKTVVDRNYLDYLVIPKVVICNSMPLRVSAVRPVREMHVILSTIYETPVLSIAVAREKNIFDVLSKIKDTKKYFHDVGHQMHDVIIGCSWKGQPCSASNFTEVITEHGVCYAFNSDTVHPLRVYHHGADYGLELVLNIARYEEMNGPFKVYGATSQPASSRSGINALVGTYTTLSLMHKEINFIKGTNCGEKPLKFFGEYTRESCILEKNFELIGKGSGEEVRLLSLHSVFRQPFFHQPLHNLVQKISDQLVGATDDECPPACKVTVDSATVSTAEVAWERLEGSFVDRTARMAKIAVDLRHAWEVATRYHPKYAVPTQLLLETLHSAERNVSAVMGQINNLTTAIPPIPPYYNVLPIMKNFEKFRTKTYDATIQIIEKALGDINKTLQMNPNAFSNQSYTHYLFGNDSLNGTTLEEIELPQKLFALSNGRVYLNTLPSFLKSLDTNRVARSNFLKEWREGFYTGNGKTLLLGNDAKLLNSTIDRLMLILFKQDDYERPNVSGCMQQPIRVKHSNSSKLSEKVNFHETVKEDTLIDIFICFQRMFTTPASLHTHAANIAQFADAIPQSIIESDQQSTICRQVDRYSFNNKNSIKGYQSNDLPTIGALQDRSNCSLNTTEQLLIAKVLVKLTAESLAECSDLRDAIKTDMSTYLKSVRSDYTKAVETGKSFYKVSRKVIETFSNPLWPKPEELTRLSNYMSNYTSITINYTDLAKIVTGTYNTWLEQTFVFNLNKVKTSLSETLDNVKSMESQLLNLLNISSNMRTSK